MPHPSGGFRPGWRHRRSKDGASVPSKDIANRFGIFRLSLSVSGASLRLDLHSAWRLVQETFPDRVAHCLNLVDDAGEHFMDARPVKLGGSDSLEHGLERREL